MWRLCFEPDIHFGVVAPGRQTVQAHSPNWPVFALDRFFAQAHQLPNRRLGTWFYDFQVNSGLRHKARGFGACDRHQLNQPAEPILHPRIVFDRDRHRGERDRARIGLKIDRDRAAAGSAIGESLGGQAGGFNLPTAHLSEQQFIPELRLQTRLVALFVQPPLQLCQAVSSTAPKAKAQFN